MSASREKQNRQAQAGQTDPKTAREAQQRKEEKRSNLLYGLIAAAFLVVVVVSVVWRSNIIPRMSTAAVIDGKSYTAAEVNYYYQTAYRNFLNQNSYFISYFGIDTNSSLKDQEISADTATMLGLEVPETNTDTADTDAAAADDAAATDAADGTDAADAADADAEAPVSTGITWYDYFVDQALDNMTVIQKALDAAEAEGYTFSAGVQAQYDANMEALRSTAAASGMSVSQYLKGSFGGGITEKVYGDQLLRVLRYSDYAGTHSDELTFSDSELEDAYSSDPNSYDLVSYEYASFDGAAPTSTDADGNTVEPTEEESAAALAAAKESAEALLADYNEKGDLEAQATAHDSTYATNDAATYTGSAVSQWLFDTARKDGDAAVVEDGTTEYVLVFHSRGRDEAGTIDVRHILIPLGTGTLTEEDEGYEDEQAQLKADAKTKAEEVLAKWQSGEATEDSFAALAMTESSDGSKYDGGLYKEVYQGQMVTEFNDWCFDAARKSGDTGVVETQYGAHVMYFVRQNMPRWQSQVSELLRSQAYSEWETGLTEGVTPERRDSGLRYVG